MHPKGRFEAGRRDSGQGMAAGMSLDHHGIDRVGRALGCAALLMAPLVMAGAGACYVDWRAEEEVRSTILEAALAHERLVEAPALPVVEVEVAARGRDLFVETCAACHGAEGRGVERLGKDLVTSDFVAGCTDDRLVAFLETGRPDARPTAMPPRGGRADLTPDDLTAIATFLRGIQDPRRMPSLPEYVVDSTPTEAQAAAALELAGGDEELAAWIASGDKLFHSTCMACHGTGGVGVAGNGKALRDNPFVQSLDDDGLLAFIQSGRGPSDPLNTTGIQMPPKGGNPALSEDDILDIISYLRTLQPDGPSALTSK